MSAKVPYPVDDDDAADAPGLAAVSKRHGWRVRQRMENWPAVVRARSEGYDEDPESVEANVRVAERRLAQARVESAAALDWAASIVREGLSDDELTLIPSADLIRGGLFEMDLEVMARTIRNCSRRGEPLEEIRLRFGDRGYRHGQPARDQRVGIEALRRLRPWLEANEAKRVVAEVDRKMIEEQRASAIAKAREWAEEEEEDRDEEEDAGRGDAGGAEDAGGGAPDGEAAREGEASDVRTGAVDETPEPGPGRGPDADRDEAGR